MEANEHYRKKDSQTITKQHLMISDLQSQLSTYKDTVKALRKENKQLKRMVK